MGDEEAGVGADASGHLVATGRASAKAQGGQRQRRQQQGGEGTAAAVAVLHGIAVLGGGRGADVHHRGGGHLRASAVPGHVAGERVAVGAGGRGQGDAAEAGDRPGPVTPGGGGAAVGGGGGGPGPGGAFAGGDLRGRHHQAGLGLRGLGGGRGQLEDGAEGR